MRNIVVTNMRKIKKAVPELENRMKVSVSFGKGAVTVNGSEVEEFLAEKIISAVDFGFDVEEALLLTNEDFVLEFIHVKDHTRRKNLKDVRARLIGTNGKAKKTIENLTGAELVINDNTVGVIVDSNHLDTTIHAIESLIQGSKHGNVFSYLEKQGSTRRKAMDDDLGLKEGFDEGEIIEEGDGDSISEDEIAEAERELNSID